MVLAGYYLDIRKAFPCLSASRRCFRFASDFRRYAVHILYFLNNNLYMVLISIPFFFIRLKARPASRPWYDAVVCGSKDPAVQ
jgi:hypothetical protein